MSTTVALSLEEKRRLSFWRRERLESLGWWVVIVVVRVCVDVLGLRVRGVSVESMGSTGDSELLRFPESVGFWWIVSLSLEPRARGPLLPLLLCLSLRPRFSLLLPLPLCVPLPLPLLLPMSLRCHSLFP